MMRIRRFEANLLTILDFFLGQAPVELALPLLIQPCARPKGLGRTTLRLVQDHLTKGCVLHLARSGGWRSERFLRGGAAVEGRLWRRSPFTELHLEFSRHVLRFLIFVTAAPLPAKFADFRLNAPRQTPADGLFFALVQMALRGVDMRTRLVEHDIFVQNALCRLAWPEDFARLSAAPPDFTPWMDGLGAGILECWQPFLLDRWLHLERFKRTVQDPETFIQLAQAQEAVLTRLFDAVESANRLDLARFVLILLERLLAERPEPRDWEPPFSVGSRLAERARFHRAALTTLRAASRLATWTAQASHVGYFDEGYGAAQLWKLDWERFNGEVSYRRAVDVVRYWETWT
jgi:hypothetical protein